MLERTTVKSASRNLLCMEFAVFTTSRVGVIYALGEIRSRDSLKRITPRRLRMGLVSAFPHLEKQHTYPSEHSGHYYGGECQWCNAAVNDYPHRKRRSKHLQKTEN
jgi:hypothetical protein